MKKAIFPILIFIGIATMPLPSQNDAAESRNKQINASPIYVGVGGSIPLGVVVTSGAFSRQGWGGSLSLNAVWRPAKNLPRDYDGGRGIFGEGSNRIDGDNMQVFSVRLIKEFPTNSKNILVGLEAGPSYVLSKIAGNFIPVPNPCTSLYGFSTCEANYTYQRTKSNSLGWSLKGKMGINIPKLVEFELGLHANLNPKWNYFGFECLGTLGLFRDK